MGQQRIQKIGRAGVRVRRVGMPLLGRKGVGVEPIQQPAAVAGDRVELRAVHMGVDEARQHQAAAVVVPGPTVVGGLAALLGTDDAATLDQQPVVGAQAHRARFGRSPSGRGDEVEQVAANGESSSKRGGHQVRSAVSGVSKNRTLARCSMPCHS